MTTTPRNKRPLSFYLNLLLAADALFILIIIFSGGIDLRIGPLQLQAENLRTPALLLLALLVIRRLLARGEKDTASWQDVFFGPAGSPTERWRSVEVLLAFTALYLFFVGGAAVARHRYFGSEALSLGVAVQAVWNTVNGRTLFISLGGGDNYLGLHFSPVLALVAQGYRLWQEPEFLLRVQTLFLALGAWPVYFIARRDLDDRRWALAMAALYLVYPAVRGMDLAGFHPATLAVAPLLMAFYLLDEKPRTGGYLFGAFALACGEEVWLAVSFFGLYLSFVRHRWREGLFLFAVTFYGYILLTTFLMPRIGGTEAAVFSRYSHLGQSAGEVLRTLFFRPAEVLALISEPGRARYLENLFLPLAWIPLFGPLRLAISLPILAGNLLSNVPSHYAAASPHTAVAVPFIFAAASAGLRRLKGGWGMKRLQLLSGPLVRWALIVLPLLSFGASPAVHYQAKVPVDYEKMLADISFLIPPEEALSTQSELVPHFAGRPEIYIFPETQGAHYVLVALDGGDSEREGGEGRRESVLHLVKEERFGVVRRNEYFILLSRGGGDRRPKTIKNLTDSL